jgi:hypothetical protein
VYVCVVCTMCGRGVKKDWLELPLWIFFFLRDESALSVGHKRGSRGSETHKKRKKSVASTVGISNQRARRLFLLPAYKKRLKKKILRFFA